MRRLSILMLVLAAVSLAPAAGSAADLMANGQFRYGMGYDEADAWLAKNEGDFIIQYRIDTASTNEIVCIYKETEFYRIRFYRGYCFFIERRAEAAAGDIAGIFDQFTAEYGNSPEITQSRDQKLWYGRWMLKDRDIELTAYSGHEGLYILTYQEFDPLLLGEALYAQEQEVMSGAVQIDPINGQPRLVSSEGGEGEAAGGEGEAAGGEGESAGGEGESAETDQPEEEEGSDDAPPEDIVDDGEDWGD